MASRLKLVVLAGALVTMLALVVAASATSAAEPRLFTVAAVTDGDTIRLTNGERVRLVQIDAPESAEECYGSKAGARAGRPAPGRDEGQAGGRPGARQGRPLRPAAAVRREGQPQRQHRPRFTGRGNRVVLRRRSRATRVQAARRGSKSAKRAGKGLWGDCPGTPFDPLSAADTGPAGGSRAPACRDGVDNDRDGKTDYPADHGCTSLRDTTERNGAPSGNCDPAYPTVCIPPPPPDLDCGDVNQKRFTVLPPDPHRFDGDHDGIGCES